MRRARIIRALPLWLQRAACWLLVGHSFWPKDRQDDHGVTHVLLACAICPAESPGYTIPPARRSRRLAGDARRFESYARKGISKAVATPDPLDPDWFADEHFQGDHARAV